METASEKRFYRANVHEKTGIRQIVPSINDNKNSAGTIRGKVSEQDIDLIIQKIRNLQICAQKHNTSSDSTSLISLDSAIQSTRQSSIELSDQEGDSNASSQTEKKESGIYELNEDVEEKDKDKKEDKDKDEDGNTIIKHEVCPYLNKPWTEVKITIVGLLDNGRQISEIKQYAIPSGYKKLLENNLKSTPNLNFRERQLLIKLISKYEPERRRSNEEDFAYTSVKKDNYNEFFHDLLYFEEQESIFNMANYNMFGVKMWVKPSRRECTLHVPGLAEKRPSILKNDTIFVRLHHEPTTQYSGFVKDVKKETIDIRGLCQDFIDRLHISQKSRKPRLVDVRFVPTRYPFFVQHRAIARFSMFPSNKVFPATENCGNSPDLLTEEALEKIEFINPDIQENKEQKQAILNILKGTSKPAPYIIFGPPGTGKTVTFVEAILQVKNKFPESHILVCAQGNSACDYIATKLLKSGDCKTTEILRFNSASRMEEVPREISHISNCCPGNEINKTYKFRIIVCTLITAGRFLFRFHSFTHLFIDEAGQAAEPEALVPISTLFKMSSKGLSEGQLILAGDPKQLGPVCNGRKAKEFGLGVSLMERLMANMSIYQLQSNEEYDGRFITQLVRNFRSHEEILQVSNNLFYNNRLLPQGIEDELCTFPLISNPKVEGFPVLFHGVEGRERKEMRSPSIYNRDEILIVINYIKELLSCGIENKVKPGEIGVIAPYALQVHKLKEEIRKHPGWGTVQVGSTEVFQGREKRVIIVSTVRSQAWRRGFDKKFNLGFVKEPKRFNVIMTRAQSKLIIIGNPKVLKEDKCWRFVIKKALENNSYRGFPFKM